jgi:hypothetical protein
MNELPDDWEQKVRETARNFPYPSTPNLAARFRERSRPRSGMARLRLSVALVVMLALFGLLTVPQVRAGIADFLQIGAVRIWQTELPPSSTAPVGTPLGTRIPLEEAQSEVWYSIRLPTYPEGLGTPDEIYLLNPQEDGLQLLWYANDRHPELRLTQFGDGFWVEKWGPAFEFQTPSTTVNGRYAVWAPGPHLWRFIGTDGERAVAVPEGNNVLIWVENNVTYRLESSLTQAEAVKVAESFP